MQAAVVHDHTSPPTVAAFEDPLDSDGFTLVTMEAAAVSPVVRAIAAGRLYSSAAPPFVAGLDGVGRTADGTLVFGAGARPPYGTLAERAPLPTASLVPIPDGLDAATAAALVNPGYSAWQPLEEHVVHGGARSVLVLGASGASGRLAVQLAKHAGATRVIAAGRAGPRLTATGPLGADAVVELGDGYAAALAEAAPDGIDLVLDYLWGDPALATMGALPQLQQPTWREVQWVQIGAAAGDPIALPAGLLRTRNLRMHGNGLGSADPADRPRGTRQLLELAAAGVVTVDFVTHPLSAMAEVWQTPERVVLLPQG